MAKAIIRNRFGQDDNITNSIKGVSDGLEISQ